MTRDEATALYERVILTPEQIGAFFTPVPRWRRAWRRFLWRLA